MYPDSSARTRSACLVDQFRFLEDDRGVVVAIHQAYRLLVELELRGIGRLAGSTSNPRQTDWDRLDAAPSGEVLEIGTLFGLGAVATMRQLASRDVDAFITIVRPTRRTPDPAGP